MMKGNPNPSDHKFYYFLINSEKNVPNYIIVENKGNIDMNEIWVTDGPRKDRRIILGKPELFYIIISIKRFPFISYETKERTCHTKGD